MDDKKGDFMLSSEAMFWTWLVRFSMFFHVRSDLLEKTPCMFYTAFWTELTSSVESLVRSDPVIRLLDCSTSHLNNFSILNSKFDRQKSHYFLNFSWKTWPCLNKILNEKSLNNEGSQAMLNFFLKWYKSWFNIFQMIM